VRLQTDDALWADDGVMSDARGQLQPISRIQRHLPAFVGKTKGDRVFDDVDDFVVGVAVDGVDIAGRIGPWVRLEAIGIEQAADGGLGWRLAFRPGTDAESV